MTAVALLGAPIALTMDPLIAEEKDAETGRKVVNKTRLFLTICKWF